METKREPLKPGVASGVLEENLICEICGRFEALRIGDRVLCADCYQGCGSCCPEFGKDDLWTFPEDQGGKSLASRPASDTAAKTKSSPRE